MVLLMIFQFLVDFVFLCFIFGEASFTGSAGTNYYIEIDGVKHGMAGDWYFIWFVSVAAAQLFFCNYKTAPVTFFLHVMAAVFVAQFGMFTNQDYLELNGTDVGWWATLKDVSTMGNTPREFVPAEAIHWAMVEAVVIVLVIIDACVQLLFTPNNFYQK